MIPAIVRRLYLDGMTLPAPYDLLSQRFGYLSQNEEDGLLLAETAGDQDIVRFRHDRVQQAMLAAMDDAQRARRQEVARANSWEQRVVEKSEHILPLLRNNPESEGVSA